MGSGLSKIQLVQCGTVMVTAQEQIDGVITMSGSG